MSKVVFGTLSDPELVELAKVGDQEACSELYRRHSPMATRVIRRITRHTEDAEDVLQETFLRALRHLPSFDGRAAFSTWLTRIAVNCALMLLRRRRAHPENSIDIKLDGGQRLAFDLTDFSPNPERICLQNEEALQFTCAVGHLPQSLRGILVARYTTDARIKELAMAFGISEAAVKTRLSRGRVKLRSALNKPRLAPSTDAVGS
jgi:RNA polymerase sigma-70 factor (ECF subfamily)